MGYFNIRQSTSELAANPSKRTEILIKMNKKVLKVTRGHFYVAITYMVHVLALGMVDAVICAMTLGKDATDNPEAWTSRLIVELTLYCLYLILIFVGSFLLMPLAQILFVTYVLTRVGKKHGSITLADYIPEARFTSTHVAQIWSMGSFFLIAWWAPTENGSIWRYVVLQACFGSALTWLEASFAFNFRADTLHDKELRVTSGGVREVLAMFGKTVKVVHTKAQTKDTLPKYQNVAHDAPEVAYSDEKECC